MTKAAGSGTMGGDFSAIDYTGTRICIALFHLDRILQLVPEFAACFRSHLLTQSINLRVL